MNPSVSSLIGKVSANSDMQINHNRNRYLTTTTVFPNQYFRMLVPKLGPNALLDCRNIRMRFTLTLTSTDAGIAVDSNLTHPFQRCRILSGSTVLYDLDNSLLAMTAIYNATTPSTVSAMEKSMIGDGDLTARQGWAAAAKEYLIPIYLPNTVLRRDGLMQIDGLSDLTLEFWTAQPSLFLYSPANDTAATYALSSIEILSEYINSPSLAAYFRAKPMAFTVNDYSWRYQTIDQQTSQVRLSSSSTSLNGFIMMLRDQNVETKFDNQDKVAVYNANDIDYENLLLNQVRFFDENIDSYPQFFRELKHLIPKPSTRSLRFHLHINSLPHRRQNFSGA